MAPMNDEAPSLVHPDRSGTKEIRLSEFETPD